MLDFEKSRREGCWTFRGLYRGRKAVDEVENYLVYPKITRRTRNGKR
jgi:hypothetical protein